MQKLTTVLLSFLLIGGFPLHNTASAESTERPALELDSDLRSRLASLGGSRTELYSNSLRLRTSLGEGLRAEVFGILKYGSFLAQEALVEKELRHHSRLQLGVIRLPFGIYDYRETYASGLIDYPLPRVDYGLNSVDWGVPGIRLVAGGYRLQLELAAFEGRAAGVWSNTNNVGGMAGRLQTYVRDLILGLSQWDGYFDTNFHCNKRRRVHVSGLDVRFTRPHLLLRGEYIFGNMGSGAMHGWYVDIYYHLPKYDRWTLTARMEALRPGPKMALGRQFTLGARYTLDRNWILSVNWRKNNGDEFYPYTWTPYAGKAGDVFFQVYRKIRM